MHVIFILLLLILCSIKKAWFVFCGGADCGGVIFEGAGSKSEFDIACECSFTLSVDTGLEHVEVGEGDDEDGRNRWGCRWGNKRWWVLPFTGYKEDEELVMFVAVVLMLLPKPLVLPFEYLLLSLIWTWEGVVDCFSGVESLSRRRS